MEELRFEINEDIGKYQTEVWKGLNIRQVKGAAIVGLIGIVSFCLLHLLFLVPMLPATWITLFFCLIGALILFVRIEEMDLLIFLDKKWKYHFHPGYYYSSEVFRNYEQWSKTEELHNKKNPIPGLFMQLFKKQSQKTDLVIEETEDEDLKKHHQEENWTIGEDDDPFLEQEEENIDFGEEFDLEEPYRQETEKSEEPMEFRKRNEDVSIHSNQEKTADNLEPEEQDEKYRKYLAESEEKLREIQNILPKEKLAWIQGIDVPEAPPLETTESILPSQIQSEFEPVVAEPEEQQNHDVEYGDTVLLGGNDGPHFHFVLVHENSKQRVMITKTPFRIGRRADFADYVIKNQTVSGTHAEFIVKGEAVLLRDMGSRNGTFIDGIRIQPEFNVEVKPGSRILFSNEEFRLEKTQ